MTTKYRDTSFGDEYQIEYVWNSDDHYEIYGHDHPDNLDSKKVSDEGDSSSPRTSIPNEVEEQA